MPLANSMLSHQHLKIRNVMASVEWSVGIDSVSGALAKPSKRGPHSCNKMLLGTHRIAETTSEHCTRIYMRKKMKRASPPRQDELANRERFKAVAQAVSTRRQNLSQVATDQAAFAAQKDQPGGKKTMRSYLWSLEAQAYDANH